MSPHGWSVGRRSCGTRRIVPGGLRTACGRGTPAPASPSSPHMGHAATWSTIRRSCCTTIRGKVHRLGHDRLVGSGSSKRFRTGAMSSFATTDGQAVLANAAGAKIAAGPPAGADVPNLGPTDAEHDLILRTTAPQVAGVNQVAPAQRRSIRPRRSNAASSPR